ncbi:hypothetical protein MYSTI_04695 [Myxococcus stipitatus DSM 14675]|uniref:Uncharacterized protein n=1 Tax=Myxococcus stipitatus (strain DSM 14675 / JCM 12634 / Mx s8) TaxID=1278073 RepID=L7UEF9_MYXSD|nr:hypothetical protein [Myxococcus stipitatus]AGC45987.1 hypothetical protein MYSTI_04695 [Myxococcus stipitatus DSM 14675]
MRQNVPHAIVIVSPGDTAVADMAVQLKDKIFKKIGRHAYTVTLHKHIANTQLQQVLTQFASGRLYVLGHGETQTIGEFQPEELALHLFKHGLKPDLDSIHVRACYSGAFHENDDDDDPNPESLPPAYRLWQALIALWQGGGDNIYVTGMTARGVELSTLYADPTRRAANQGKFRALREHPSLKWIDKLRENSRDRGAIENLLDIDDPGKLKGFRLSIHFGIDVFTARFLGGQRPPPQYEGQELDDTVRTQVMDARRQLLGAQPPAFDDVDEKANLIAALIRYLIIDDLDSSEEDEASETPDMQGTALQDEILSTLDNIAPLLHETLLLDRTTSKAVFGHKPQQN